VHCVGPYQLVEMASHAPSTLSDPCREWRFKIEQAVREFQRRNGLPGTGVVSEVRDRLRQSALQDPNASYRLCARDWTREWCQSTILLYRQSAERGDSEAQYRLGNAYSIEARDKIGDARWQATPLQEEATKWIRRAAEQGHTEAEALLGDRNVMGIGTPVNYWEAVKWLRRAAEKGVPYSQRDLGSMYEDGQGVEQDYVSAYKWYELAASHPLPWVSGTSLSSSNHARTLTIELRDRVAAKMTSAQIAEAKRLAREWLEQHPAARQR
jgi:TPR repeat protein